MTGIPLILLLLIVAMVWLVFSAVTSQRRNPGQYRGEKLCPACGAAHPPFASFCRRCGRRV